LIFVERCDGGSHATTRLAAAALRGACAGLTVLDVGTGDGALARLAVACGASRVVALDRDGGVAGVASPAAGVEARAGDILVAPPAGTFDVVVANLPEEVALAALPALAACARRTLIVTGGRLPRATTFARRLRGLRLAVAPPTALDGWFCVTAVVGD
jgi:ribosomal protein L11 methylase PrmA